MKHAGEERLRPPAATAEHPQESLGQPCCIPGESLILTRHGPRPTPPNPPYCVPQSCPSHPSLPQTSVPQAVPFPGAPSLLPSPGSRAALQGRWLWTLPEAPQQSPVTLHRIRQRSLPLPPPLLLFNTRNPTWFKEILVFCNKECPWFWGTREVPVLGGCCHCPRSPAVRRTHPCCVPRSLLCDPTALLKFFLPETF